MSVNVQLKKLQEWHHVNPLTVLQVWTAVRNQSGSRTKDKQLFSHFSQKQSSRFKGTNKAGPTLRPHLTTSAAFPNMWHVWWHQIYGHPTGLKQSSTFSMKAHPACLDGTGVHVEACVKWKPVSHLLVCTGLCCTMVSERSGAQVQTEPQSLAQC